MLDENDLKVSNVFGNTLPAPRTITSVSSNDSDELATLLISDVDSTGELYSLDMHNADTISLLNMSGPNALSSYMGGAGLNFLDASNNTFLVSIGGVWSGGEGDELWFDYVEENANSLSNTNNFRVTGIPVGAFYTGQVIPDFILTKPDGTEAYNGNATISAINEDSIDLQIDESIPALAFSYTEHRFDSVNGGMTIEFVYWVTQIDWNRYFVNIGAGIYETEWDGDFTLSAGSYTVNATNECTLVNSDATNGIDVPFFANRHPSAMTSGYKGEILLSDSYSIIDYLGGEGRRQWSWHSKDITLGEDNKFKKFYNVSMTTNLEQIENDKLVDVPNEAIFDQPEMGSVFAEYKVNGGIMPHGFTEKGRFKSEHRKSKSVKLIINSRALLLKSIPDDPDTEEDEAKDIYTSSELSSISLAYRRLPNTSGNF